MSFIDSSNDSSLVSTPAHKLDTPKSVFFNIGKRALDRDNIFKQYRADQKMKLSVSKLSDQQVISSQTYQQLLQKFQRLLQQKQGVQHKRAQSQRLARIEQKIKSSKQQIHGHKYIIWELKNEVMSLQQEISNEINQYNYLHECLMDENENQQPDSEDFDNNQDQQNHNNYQYSGTNVYMLRSRNQKDDQNGNLASHNEIGRDLFDDKEIFGYNEQEQNEQEPENNELIGEEKQQEQQETQMNQISRMYGGGMIKRISLCSQL